MKTKRKRCNPLSAIIAGAIGGMAINLASNVIYDRMKRQRNPRRAKKKR